MGCSQPGKTCTCPANRHPQPPRLQYPRQLPHLEVAVPGAVIVLGVRVGAAGCVLLAGLAALAGGGQVVPQAQALGVCQVGALQGRGGGLGGGWGDEVEWEGVWLRGGQASQGGSSVGHAHRQKSPHFMQMHPGATHSCQQPRQAAQGLCRKSRCGLDRLKAQASKQACSSFTLLNLRCIPAVSPL